ncbi:ABC transporter permease [Azospirillum doebereinerae]
MNARFRHRFVQHLLRGLRAAGPVLPAPFRVAPVCLVLAVAVFAATAPRFLSLGNAVNIGGQVWVLALLAIGQMFALATRGFDISVGAVAALSSVCAALACNAWGLPGLGAGALAGLLCGLVNGALIGGLGLQPVVATLGSLIALRGLSLLITDDGQVVPLDAVGVVTRLGFEPLLGLPAAGWAALALAVGAALLVSRSLAGRRILMAGSNPEAVALVGVDTVRVHLWAYGLCGLFAGFAGVLMTVRAGSGLPTEGAGMELQAIAAAVIGGTALGGGVASVAAVVVGAAFIQVLLTGLNLQGVSPFVAQIAVGVVIIAAGLLETALRSLLSSHSHSRSWS